jgi:hypothetical protein
MRNVNLLVTSFFFHSEHQAFIRGSRRCKQSVCRAVTVTVTEDRMPFIPTERGRNQATCDAWLQVRDRKVILEGLVDLLHRHLDSVWVKSHELFNADTLPETISSIGFSRGVWSTPDHEYQGTQVFNASTVDDRYILLRHKFGNKWCLRGVLQEAR